MKHTMKQVAMGVAVAALALSARAEAEKEEQVMMKLHDIAVTRITGEAIKMDAYKGKVVLIVNTASKCGFTGQYDGLEKLHQRYAEKGFAVLGFPSNDFMKQEPGSNEEIQTFCRLNYGVTFPMFEKVVVKKGADQHPLYRFLTEKESNPDHSGSISWNFNKFLVDGEGKVLARFGSRTKPDDPELIAAIAKALAKP